MKKRISQTALSTLFTSSLLLGTLTTGLPQWSLPVLGVKMALAAEKSTDIQKVKGKITNISQKAKTIALNGKDGGFILLKFTDDTTLKNADSPRDFKPEDAVLVEYETVNGENIVKSLQKALVKLPKGIEEIKTEELAAMLQKKPEKVALIDARPKVKYDEGHIAGAISLPYATLKKEGENGAKPLAKYKDRQLIFYCGGPT